MGTEEAYIEKSEIRASVLLLGAKPSAYRLYLAAQAPDLNRRERITDVLGDRDFLPLRAGRGEDVHLVNREHIVWLAVALKDVHADPGVGGQRVPVKVVLFPGGVLTGELRYVLPEPTTRVSDYLERGDPFIPLWQADRCVWVNRARICRILTHPATKKKPTKRRPEPSLAKRRR